MNPTFVIVHLVSIPIHHIHLKEVQECAGDQEAVREGKIFDVAHVQGKGVRRRRNRAQANQLTDHIPNAHTLEKQKERGKKNLLVSSTVRYSS